MNRNISRFLTTAVLAIGLLATGFMANAAEIRVLPSQQFVTDGSSFYVEIQAFGLPVGTSGGKIDVFWDAADMTLNNVWLATTDSADHGNLIPGPWDPVSTLFSDPGVAGTGMLSGLLVGAFFGVDGDQPVARLDFTLGSGVTDSVIYAANAAVGGVWSAFDPTNGPYDFTPDYVEGIVNPTAPPIPIPAAVWLFGSGLLGLASVARRRG